MKSVARVFAVKRLIALTLTGGLVLPQQMLYAQSPVAGLTPGGFRVSETGAAVYTVPVRVPPGTAGVEPKLALSYNSQVGNGLIGTGWQLEGLSAVTRCPRTLAQDGVRGAIGYDKEDRFCLDGQRLMLVAGTIYGAGSTGYRTEREDFSKISASAATIAYPAPLTGVMPESFTVKTKAGLTMEYGASTDSRIEAQGKVIVRVWALTRMTDTKGNAFTVSYTEDATNGDYRPEKIEYGANKVAFTYEAADRPDVLLAYLGGSVQRTVKRLSKITTSAGTPAVTELRFAYAPRTTRCARV